MKVCPLCLTAYAANGSCSCDVDGIPPGRRVEQLRHVTAGSATRRVSIERRLILVHAGALDHDVRPAGCSCGRPTRDGAFICVGCSVRMADLLVELPQVMADLDSRLTASIKGIDYQSWGESRGAGEDFRPDKLDVPARAWLRANEHQGTANPTALPIVPHAVEARTGLVSGVRWLVASSLIARLKPDPRVPVDDVTSWLRARVDAMALHPAFWGAPDGLEHLIDKALRSVAPYVATSEQHGLDTVTRDAVMLRAFTASEIAGVAVSIGEVDGTRARDTTEVRRRIRKLVDQWHHRGRISPVSWTDDPKPRPKFRFGEVHLLLLHAPASKAVTPTALTPARPGLDGLADWPNPNPTKENR